MTPRPGEPGLHALITTPTGEIHRYVWPVHLRTHDGVRPAPGQGVRLVVTATAESGSLALRGVEDSR